MSTSTLTTKDIQLIYESAVHDEATKSDESGFVLDCVLDDAGGTGATIRKLIDMVRARDVELLAVREAQPVAVESVASCILDGTLINEGTGEPVSQGYTLPAGFKLVPVEPTKEMIDAGWCYFMGSKNPSSKGVYHAMLAAAPTPTK